LLCKIVTTPGKLTKRWIYENFLGRYSTLLQDETLHVRKVIILGTLAMMYGTCFTEQFAVPFLLALSKDAVWSVRKTSCDVFVDVAMNCTMETKYRKLTPCFISFIQMVIPQPLLDSFIQMVRPANADDADINQQCARSFPAVAFTLGRRNWSCIVGTYKQLSSDMQWRVRHALASSIHEIAAIIGEENADVHLAPVFEQFMKDIGSVKLGLLSHLYDFFKCILLCDLFNIHDINEYLVAIALTLANDRISDVRKEATKLLAKILGKLVKKEWILDCFDSSATDVSSLPVTKSFISDIVKGFSRSMNWRRRQT
uniref:HEAT repeat-containing protein 1 n=1 Tax=Thelazia callipaeda TaxID=103827 RepID=A0A158RC34_THECL